MTDAQRKEIDAWQALVAALKACGAVTDEDCKQSRGREPHERTQGEQLFAKIRQWEIARIKLYESILG